MDSGRKKEKKNVICIRWGVLYDSESVNRLYRSVLKNTTYDINFFCFTDSAIGLDRNIIAKPLPKLKNLAKVNFALYLKEAGLCDDNLGGLGGQRVLFFDLDVLIVDNIDSFFELPKDEEFYIIKDWNSCGRNVGQASCYSWKVGTLGFIREYFEKNYRKVYKKYRTASQEYLSAKIIEKYGKLNFWPGSWCRSFKVHCLPTPFIPFLRKIKMATIPGGAKIICFHGLPKMDDAALGIWPEKNPIKRFFYKHLKPVEWIGKKLEDTEGIKETEEMEMLKKK